MDIHEYQAKELLSELRGADSARQASPTLPSRPSTAPPRSAATTGSSRRRSTRAAAARPAASLCSNDARGRARPPKPCSAAARHQADRARGASSSSASTSRRRTDIAKELYLGFVLDRRSERIVRRRLGRRAAWRSRRSRRKQPDTIIRVVVEPAVGMQAFQARELAFGLGLDARRSSTSACRPSWAPTAPSAISTPPWSRSTRWSSPSRRTVVALDAKMSFDDNALFRRPHIAELRDNSQEDPRETEASERGLNYVGLDGDIGCIVNGAGLAMATMDMIKLAGGEPANFLDVGGGASPERVAAAFRLVLARPARQGHAASTSSPASTAATGSRRASSRPHGARHQDARSSCGLPAPTSRKAVASSTRAG